MKITGDWITTPHAQQACALLTDHGYQAFFVGGCVRNDLLGVSVNDLDIATDAPPTTVMDLAQAAGLQAIPTGIDHGTITVVIGGHPFEITTFRRDIDTDGRHARVIFSTDVTEDAARRDFTMNALYARADGTIVDPLGGLDDLRQRHVRFIGTATDRIREDYLRILRFFRFSLYYGDPDIGFDADALDAIARQCDGLSTLSRERVTSEMMKILSAPDPAPVVATMRSTGVLTALFSGADDRALGPLVHMETLLGLIADPVRRLAALGIHDVSQSLRLSKVQGKDLAHLRGHIGSTSSLGELAYRHGAPMAQSVAALRAALFETPPAPDVMDEITQGASAVFPVTAADLMPMVTGAALGERLRSLEARWIKSGFLLTKSDLLK